MKDISLLLLVKKLDLMIPKFNYHLHLQDLYLKKLKNYKMIKISKKSLVNLILQNLMN